MQLPSLRRPVGASVAGRHRWARASSTRCWRRARGGATGAVVLLALGLYGAAALLAGARGRAGVGALAAPGRPAGGSLRDDPDRDRAVAAGILAGVRRRAGRRRRSPPPGSALFVGKMPSQKLATIAAGGLVAIGALPGAVAAIAALPLLRRAGARPAPPARARARPASCCWRWRRPARSAFVAALSRADWRVLDLGPLYALAIAVVLGAGARAVLVLARRPGRALRARLPAASGARCRSRLAVVAVVGLVVGRAACPRARPAFGAVADDGSWGCAPLLAPRAALTDHDGDGFSARFGGGDCDDRRADVYPGAEDVPGDGVDQNCEGGDAKPAAAPRRRPARRRRRGRGRAERPGQAARRTRSRATS